MANYRPIHCKMWSDPVFEPLSSDAKLLFCYLLTNSLRMPSGLYVITERRMAQDTNMSKERVDKAKDELVESGLAMFDDEKSIVWIKNALKYLQNTPQIRKSVINDLCFNANSSLVEAFLTHHPSVRLWPEWNDDVQFTLDSDKAKKEWNDGIEF